MESRPAEYSRRRAGSNCNAFTPDLWCLSTSSRITKETWKYRSRLKHSIGNLKIMSFHASLSRYRPQQNIANSSKIYKAKFLDRKWYKVAISVHLPQKITKWQWSELQIIFESNAYLRPNFLLNADFQFQKVFSPPVIFSNAEREGITVLKCRIWISFGVILIIALVVTCYYFTLEYILTIFWQYVDKRTDRLTSTIQSFTFVLRHVLTISTHCTGHLMRTPIC